MPFGSPSPGALTLPKLYLASRQLCMQILDGLISVGRGLFSVGGSVGIFLLVYGELLHDNLGLELGLLLRSHSFLQLHLQQLHGLARCIHPRGGLPSAASATASFNARAFEAHVTVLARESAFSRAESAFISRARLAAVSEASA
eukprot:4603363-Pleurochrysis_carterae.AAC.1